MTIAIFGASGATGNLLTERSLAAGHNVTALLRTPANFPLRDKVKFVHGSAFDPAPSARLSKGQTSSSRPWEQLSLRKENVLPRAVPLIVDAMRQTGVRRIIVLGSAGALPPRSTNNRPGAAGSSRTSSTPLPQVARGRTDLPVRPLAAAWTGPWSCRRCSPTAQPGATTASTAKPSRATAAASPAQT